MENNNQDDATMRARAAELAAGVLPIWEAAYPGDPRPREAIKAARDFSRGEIDFAALGPALLAAEAAAVGAITDEEWLAVAAAEAACDSVSPYWSGAEALEMVTKDVADVEAAKKEVRT